MLRLGRAACQRGLRMCVCSAGASMGGTSVFASLALAWWIICEVGCPVQPAAVLGVIPEVCALGSLEHAWTAVTCVTAHHEPGPLQQAATARFVRPPSRLPCRLWERSLTLASTYKHHPDVHYEAACSAIFSFPSSSSSKQAGLAARPACIAHRLLSGMHAASCGVERH